MKYKIYWEVRKSAVIEARSQEEAIELLMSTDIKSEEEEITMQPMVIEETL